MKISSLRYLSGQGLKSVWTNRVMSFASFCILMVSLLLVGASMLFSANINRVVSGIEDKNEVAVFLNDDIAEETIPEITAKLEAINNIASVTFISKDESWEDFRVNIDGSDELFQYIGDESPLPHSYKIKIKDLSEMSGTVMEIGQVSGVSDVRAPKDFAGLLTDLKQTVTLISTAVIVALIVVCMVIISNATRSSVFSRRKEINIMKYVGATNTFIRIPFFIEGMFTGVLAGTVAGFLTWFGYDSLINILSQEMSLFNAFEIKEFIPFTEVAVKVFVGYIVSGALLGSLGTIFSTRKHLKV
ncbi:MAG: permease-like cell division protein FtsX [Oscillospiraceae bacterium]